jgi:hypothetical protein
MQLHIQNSQSVNPDEPVAVSGRGLAHRRLTRKQRVQLAADLATGQRRLDPSMGQISVLLGVPSAAIAAEIKARVGRNGNGGKPDSATLLIQAWDAASDSEREAAVKAVGVGAVWDVITRVVA